jgi:hypothetical protein
LSGRFDVPGPSLNVVGSPAVFTIHGAVPTMSGPIIRKYGFPNFEKIFGERSMQHGVDETETPEESAQPEPAGEAEAKTAPKSSKKKK